MRLHLIGGTLFLFGADVHRARIGLDLDVHLAAFPMAPLCLLGPNEKGAADGLTVLLLIFCGLFFLFVLALRLDLCVIGGAFILTAILKMRGPFSRLLLLIV